MNKTTSHTRTRTGRHEGPDTQQQPAVSLGGVDKNYGPVAAVRELNLQIDRGETVALLGPNGAGKSTTVAVMLGLTAPDAGHVAICGTAPRAAVLRGRIAAMLQDAGFMPGVTVSELLTLGSRLYPHPLGVGETLELAQLSTLARRRVNRLSGGQSQRLRFALAAVANPEVLVLDEPTTALDVTGRAEFWQAMRAYSSTGRTLLFATHYLEEVSENAGRAVVMMGGSVIADGTPEAIRRLAGLSTIRFSLDPDAGARRQLEALPGACDVELSGNRASVRTGDPDTTIRALVASTIAWRNLEVAAPTLDDSFRILTKDPS
ncbi:sulfate ABC transporter ATP-binding protein [Arthrobacter livingstonensis]|uniref:Sulfate ABC transporter ATP-binding protein n=1 Tax=Arthrobacter livingstonensis TaxID=670078 RepID=A0A2V5LU95_9MICC|nr:ABC transporter ATP-binding protein [Arthrobacter livingstonensis]PYI65476.1 sulfate ABC transporter ATP-binding protein [Arthrobacter livingstonensis]